MRPSLSLEVRQKAIRDWSPLVLNSAKNSETLYIDLGRKYLVQQANQNAFKKL